MYSVHWIEKISGQHQHQHKKHIHKNENVIIVWRTRITYFDAYAECFYILWDLTRIQRSAKIIPANTQNKNKADYRAKTKLSLRCHMQWSIIHIILWYAYTTHVCLCVRALSTHTDGFGGMRTLSRLGVNIKYLTKIPASTAWALNFGSCIMNKGKKRENPTLLPKLMCRISFVRHASALWTLFCRKTAPTWWTWNGICHQQRDTEEKNTNKTASDSKNALTQTLRERDTSKQWSESMKIECSNYFPVGIRCGFNMPSDSKHCFTWHIDGELKWMFFPSVTFKHSQMEKLKQTKKSLAFFAILFFC